MIRIRFFMITLLVLSGCGGDDEITSLRNEAGSGGCSGCYTIGNDVEFSGGVFGLGADTIWGWTYTVVVPTNVMGFGVIVNGSPNPTPNGRMSIYTDNAGTPFSLVVGSGPQPIIFGINLFAVSPTPISSGTYWIGVNSDSQLNFKQGPSRSTERTPLVFPSPWPDPQSGPPVPILNPEMNVWITVQD